jgi:hypothetical protein
MAQSWEPADGAFSENAIMGLMIATAIGVSSQFSWQLPQFELAFLPDQRDSPTASGPK